MTPKYLKIVILSLLILSHDLGYSQDTWELRKDKNGVQVYYRNSQDSDIKELKIVAEITGSLTSAISVINDIEGMPNWVFNCEKAEILAGDTDSSFVFVNKTAFPFPFTDRELVFSCTTYQDTSTLVAYSRCIASPESLALNDNYVRVQHAISTWTFTPIGQNRLKAEYFLSTDPGGSIPAWLINWGLDYGPLKSLEKFKELLGSEKYRNGKLSFIKEP